ncbi:MAG: ABC transporter permease [bacterium]|nr:ABC transporter permease [bacterium]
MTVTNFQPMTTTIIRPKKVFSLEDLKEVWRYKELLYFFTWRDFKVRYKQTTIGILWAIFQPFITMVVFSIFFGTFLKIPSDGIPYPIFVYTGLLFWTFFSSALSETSGVLINNQSIITKVYFPRLILPLSSVTTKFVDFAIAAVILGGMMVYYGYTPQLISILVLPILLAVTFMAAVGGGLFLAALNVKYRDVRFVLPFFIQLLLFITPVIYPASIAGKYSWILAMNPMMGVIQNARAVLLGTASINWILIGISFAACTVLLIIGVIYFKKVERYFADII